MERDILATEEKRKCCFYVRNRGENAEDIDMDSMRDMVADWERTGWADSGMGEGDTSDNEKQG